MTAPLLGPDEGLCRRFEVAAPPAQTRAMLERAVRLTGGMLVAARTGGFDFAPYGHADPARGSVDLAICRGGTICLVRVGWPLGTLARFAAVVVAVAAATLPFAVQRGPVAFAATLGAITAFGFGRYLVALGFDRVTLHYLTLVARSLATSTLYRAAPPASPASETRRLVGELCAGRIMPTDFTRARRLLLAGQL